MEINKKAAIEQIDTVLSQCALRSPKGYVDFSDLPKSTVIEAVNLLFAAIHRLAPPGTSYRRSAELLVGRNGHALMPLTGILRALRSDYENGYLQSFQELLHADIFADFLAMAKYLLEQGYKDPSAVIVGSVLEEHLRKLSLKNGIPIDKEGGTAKKADTLNADLSNANVYSRLDMKSVTSWLDLRNKAAHGHYDVYTQEQVDLMLRGVQDFITRHSA
jgi:hypothetical protein